MSRRKFQVWKNTGNPIHPDRPWVVQTPERQLLYFGNYSDVLKYIPFGIEMRSF